MAGQEFKATEKSVLKNTRDGAALKNLVSNTAERVSKRTEDAVLKKEVSPELLAQYKAAGIEKPTIPHRQFKNLQFGRNNPDKPRSDDERDNQQSEQTVMAFAPVVSINFAPKEVPDRDYTTRALRSRRKAQTKADIAEQIANQPEKVVAEVVDVNTLSEGSPFDDNVEIVDAEIAPEVIDSDTKLHENKTRITIEEHSALSDKLCDDSESSTLIFEAEPVEQTGQLLLAENSESRQIPRPVREQVESDVIVVDVVPEDSSKLQDDKTRVALSEHSSASQKLVVADSSSALIIEAEAEVIEEIPQLEGSKPLALPCDENVIEVECEEVRPKTKKEKQLEKKIRKGEKKLDKLDYKLAKAEDKLPHHRVFRVKREYNAEKGKVQSKLRLEKEIKPSDYNKFLKAGAKSVGQTVSTSISGAIHGQISKYEDDNQTLKAAHGTEKVAESALRSTKNAIKTINENQKNAPYRKASKLKFQREQTEQKLTYHKAALENPNIRGDNKAVKQAMKKSQQKRNQVNNAKKAKKTTTKVKEVAKKAEEKIVKAIASNKWAILIIVIFLIVFALLGTFGTSIATSLVDGGTQMVATTYTADDEDIYSAEGYLAGRESELSDYISNIPNYYVGWNEYNYYLDDIGHDPYQLISYLSAVEIAFDYDSEIQALIDEIYNEMYTLEIVSTHEVRSYTYTEIDEEGNEVEVTVYYDYYILDVTLTTADFESVIKPKLEALGVYDLYLAMLENKGGKPNLF